MEIFFRHVGMTCCGRSWAYLCQGIMILAIVKAVCWSLLCFRESLLREMLRNTCYSRVLHQCGFADFNFNPQLGTTLITGTGAQYMPVCSTDTPMGSNHGTWKEWFFKRISTKNPCSTFRAGGSSTWWWISKGYTWIYLGIWFEVLRMTLKSSMRAFALNGPDVWKCTRLRDGRKTSIAPIWLLFDHILMYIMIEFDMVWYDMICSGMIWYDMIWYDLIWSKEV